MYGLRWALVPMLIVGCSALPFDEEIYVPHLGDTLVVTRLPRRGPVQPPSELHVVNSVLPLTRAEGQSPSSVYVQAIRAAALSPIPGEHGLWRRSAGGVTPFVSISAAIFTVPVTIGGATYQLVVDTGSSDPWVAAANFTCIDPPTKTVEDQSYCSFGPLYDPTTSISYSYVQNRNFNVTYVDGERLSGNMGTETFGIAGLRVPQQMFGVVQQAAWYGDTVSSGLVGFAYSTLTSSYAGTDPSKDIKGQQITYPTLFTNIYQKGLASPIFSIAMSRNASSAGVMAIGGIPNVPHSPFFAAVPIQPVAISGSTGQYLYQFYTVITDGWAWSASQSAQFNVAGTNNRFKTNLVGNGTQVIVDSGTVYIYAPNNVAAGVASSFNPPATFDDYQGAYVVDCDSVAPVVGISIGKKIFYINPIDLFIQGPNLGQCYLGIQPNMGGLTILGSVWMKNVLAVFDIGAEQMRFAAREFYSTPPCNLQSCPGLQ